MRRVATPGEVAAWQRQLEAVPQQMHDRIPAMIGMLAEVVAECAHCEAPVRRCDTRDLAENGLVHLRCVAVSHHEA
jgi:hypothetical protein